MNRIDRLMAMLTTLQSKKQVSAEYLAEKFDISLRTVYRDLKALGEIGVPVYFEQGKGYTIMQGYFLPPVSLNTEEANALMLISSLADKFVDKTTQTHISNAIDKIKAVMRHSDKDKADFLQSQISIYKSSKATPHSDYLSEIQNAIVNKNQLYIEYINNNGVFSKRTVEPIGLTFYTEQWHLIAWCWNREDYRDFKVNEIRAFRNTGEKFQKSDHYDINEYIRSLF